MNADELFIELIIGEGMFIFLIAFSMATVWLSTKTKYTAIFVIPISVLLILDYLEAGTDPHLYAALFLLLLMLFSVLQLLKND